MSGIDKVGQPEGKELSGWEPRVASVDILADGVVVGLRESTIAALGARPTMDQTSAAARKEAFDALFALLREAIDLGGAAAGKARGLLDELRCDHRPFVAYLAVEERLFSYPSDTFLDCCAAVLAWDLDGHQVGIRHSHGWPVLSLRPRAATIAEGGGIRTSSPGGQA